MELLARGRLVDGIVGIVDSAFPALLELLTRVPGTWAIGGGNYMLYWIQYIVYNIYIYIINKIFIVKIYIIYYLYYFI